VADCPQVIVYKPAWLTAKVMQRLGKRKDIRFLSMLNLGMNQRVAPELLHSDCTPQRIAGEVARLLDSTDATAAMRSLYARFRQAMSHGSWDDAADAIVGLARPPQPSPSP
jgi:lipid A disaccharide synthetase